MTTGPAGQLLDIVAGFSQVELAIWGDLVVDEFLLGQVNRISREAPVLILDYVSSEFIPGGAANTAANVAALGATARPLGVVGKDMAGGQLLQLLERLGTDVSGIMQLDTLATPTKTRVSGSGLHTTRQQLVRIDRGQAHDLAPAVVSELQGLAEERGRACHGLIVGDYGYQTVDPAATRDMAARLRTAGKLVAVDSRWRLLEFSGVSCVTPNEPEVEAALGLSLRQGSASNLERAGQELLQRLHCDSILITRGSHGMAVFPRDAEAPTLLPVFGTDEVADVTGAGDTVMATFAVALATGAAPAQAARLANYAGGLVVMKQGTATVSQDELRQAILQDQGPTPLTTAS